VRRDAVHLSSERDIVRSFDLINIAGGTNKLTKWIKGLFPNILFAHYCPQFGIVDNGSSESSNVLKQKYMFDKYGIKGKATMSNNIQSPSKCNNAASAQNCHLRLVAILCSHLF
jgi:hypothetical protein